MRLHLFSLLLIVMSVIPAHAGHLHKEKEYQLAWCKGETEARLADGTRVDCLTKNYAVEVDFAHKWPEALGQALHYADMTGKRPAVLLIIERDKDWRYYNRLKRTARKQGVKLWYITPKGLL